MTHTTNQKGFINYRFFYTYFFRNFPKRWDPSSKKVSDRVWNIVGLKKKEIKIIS
jgi:hypothetical protein